MKISYLPSEILFKIFEVLSLGDLLTANLVCQQWRHLISIILSERVVVMAAEDINSGVDTLTHSPIIYKHWIFKNIDINYKAPFELLWEHYGEFTKTLTLLYVDIGSKDLVNLLHKCIHLEQLELAGLSQMLMTGTFLENENDILTLRKTLKHVKCLRLSCSRYLTDCIFSRITYTVGYLKELSLEGCQISYQNSIWRRFYPPDGSVKASEHVFTFKYVLGFIENNKKTLKTLNLGKTNIDSDSLGHLSQVPGLELQSLRLMACDQLTKSGIQVLTQHQKQLVELDIGLCSRVTDYAVLAIADNLPCLQYLCLKRCRGITETGVENLSRLKHLKKLDISHLTIRKWESIHKALGKTSRPAMRWLSVASLPIHWETVLAFAETMPYLRHLDLSMCVMGVTDKSMQVICKSLVGLEVLFLTGCAAISDIGLSGLEIGNRDESVTIASEMLLSLETLGIKERDPFKISLGSKAEQQILQEAQVKRYFESNKEEVITSSEYGLKNIQGLREVSLCGCTRITDLTLCYALQFKDLTYLNLSRCQQVNEDGLIEMSMTCPSLEDLFLAECSNTSDRVILVFVHRLKRIKTLDLQLCNLLTNDALDSISGFRKLRYLDVSGCHKMSLEEVRALRKKIPRLLDLHHRGIKPASQDENPDWEDSNFLGANNVPTPPPLLSKLLKKFTR